MEWICHLPGIIKEDLHEYIKQNGSKVRTAFDKEQTEPVYQLTSWDVENQRGWNKLEDLYRRD